MIAEADALLGQPEGAAAVQTGPPTRLGSPLEGVVVLDLGLAVAGPFGTQVLAELGARVIKVNTLSEKFWLSNHIAMCCNRDKESITLNLKDPEALSVLYRLVERADVVQHNMRYDAAERLGVDYESLRQLNPELIYCHTLGHEQGPRQADPGNDQTGAALAGTEWLDGGLDNDGRPIWSVTSLGDTGNGFLSALGIIQALFDRDRTGHGQFVRTSILYAHLLNTSTAWITPDGSVAADRQKPDAEQYWVERPLPPLRHRRRLAVHSRPRRQLGQTVRRRRSWRSRLRRSLRDSRGPASQRRRAGRRPHRRVRRPHRRRMVRRSRRRGRSLRDLRP